jgi:hypothetical protein
MQHASSGHAGEAATASSGRRRKTPPQGVLQEVRGRLFREAVHGVTVPAMIRA